MAKKKFATTRGILSRMRSDSSINGSTKSCNGESLSTVNLDCSEDSRASTFGSSSRKSSFRFGRKKKSLAPGLSIIETTNEQQVDTDEIITPLTDYSIQTNTSEYVIDGSKRPPLLPPTMSTTPVKKSTTTTLTQQQPKLMKRTRSLTPSDIHYLNSTESTKFGSVPISQHYETNEQLLDLFTTLYENGVKTDPSVVENVAEGAGSMGTVNNQTTTSSEEYSRVAYAAGVKFVEVALFTIPQHGYYKSNENEYQDKRTKSIVDAVKVTQLLGELIDEEDMEQKRIDRLSSVAYKSLEEVVKDGNKKKQGVEETSGYNMDDVKSHISRIWNDARVEGDKILNQCVLPDDICSFLNICGGQGMNYVVEEEEEDVVDKPVEGLSIHHGRKRHKAMSRPPVMPQKDEDGDVNMASDTTDEVDRYTPNFKKKISIKPPLHTAPSSPSASVAQSSRVSMTSSTPSILTESAVDEVPQVEKNKQAEQEPITSSNAEFDCNSALQLALSLSMNMEKGEDNVNIVSSCESTVATDSQDKNSVAILASLYQEQYTSLREKGVFHVRFLDTYQGRNPLSTNGCTVIGPLLCIHYFTCSEENRVSSSASIFSEDKLYWDSGIPDELINQVIDDHAASILPVVRENLNIGHDSFIIPSDVHDHLIEVGLLSTSSFVGVCGGNILDEQHLSSFKSTLLLLDDKRERERLRGRKIGATLFFHAHVIAIHVINIGDDVWIELIDSLPNPDTWINSCPNEVEMMDYEYSNEQIQNAIRVRCTDVEHFHTLILQYALTKFSEEEQRFILSNEFDERNCESSFDPRVFQAFVWAEASE